MEDALRLGVAGLGTVGASVIRLIEEHGQHLAARCRRPVNVVAVAARDRTRDRGVDLSPYAWYDDALTLARSNSIDVLVELIGGEDGPALDVVRAALSSGRHVVTANKALLAKHGMELAGLAEANGVSLNFEAAIAGGIPIVKTLRESLSGNSVSRVSGILNGTCNYILTRMEREGLSFEECLKEAQRLGYAEADPTFDIEGNDTAHKLALLTSLAFGCQTDVESIYMEGITEISTADIAAADELGYRIKLLGIAQRTETGIEQRVHPTMVPKSSAIARIDGVLNAVAVEADYLDEVVLVGPGTGGNATASSVVADIADIARGDIMPTFGRPAQDLEPYERARMRRHEGGYFIRLSVYDRPGAFATIARCMAEKNISLESIVQRRRAPRTEAPELPADAPPQDSPQPVIMITYETTEADIKAALEAIRRENVIVGQPRMIRIERKPDAGTAQG